MEVGSGVHNPSLQEWRIITSMPSYTALDWARYLKSDFRSDVRINPNTGRNPWPDGEGLVVSRDEAQVLAFVRMDDWPDGEYKDGIFLVVRKD